MLSRSYSVNCQIYYSVVASEYWLSIDNLFNVIENGTKLSLYLSSQMWQFAPNSVHYLLSLWQRMVASIPYVRAVEPHHLDTYTPEVTKAYITSRLDSARIIIRDGLEDPLDDLAMVQQQLDQLSVIVRCEYEQTCNFVIHTFDQVSNLR